MSETVRKYEAEKLKSAEFLEAKREVVHGMEKLGILPATGYGPVVVQFEDFDLVHAEVTKSVKLK